MYSTTNSIEQALTLAHFWANVNELEKRNQIID